MSKISINLVTWNGEKYIHDCLKSIEKQTFKDYFLLIIDNGSADRTVPIIEQEFLPVMGDKARLIKNKENIGFAQAHNQGILWTNCDYVLTLNQDVILEPDFLSEAVKFMDSQTKAGSLSPKILKFIYEQKDEIRQAVKTDIIDSIGLKITKAQRFLELGTGEKDTGQYEKSMEIFGPSGTAPVYRRSALEAVRIEDEFFDNDFFSYKEDVDLAYRLQLLSWQSFYLPTAVAYHDRKAKSSKGVKFKEQKKMRQVKNSFINYHSYKNHLFILVKDLSWGNFFRYFPYIFFYELGKFFYTLIFEFSTFKSLGLFFAKLGKMLAKRKIIMKNSKKGARNIRKWFK